MIALSSLLAHSKRVPSITNRSLLLSSSSSSFIHSSAMASQQEGPVTTSIRTTVTHSTLTSEYMASNSLREYQLDTILKGTNVDIRVLFCYSTPSSRSSWSLRHSRSSTIVRSTPTTLPCVELTARRPISGTFWTESLKLTLRTFLYQRRSSPTAT